MNQGIVRIIEASVVLVGKALEFLVWSRPKKVQDRDPQAARAGTASGAAANEASKRAGR